MIYFCYMTGKIACKCLNICSHMNKHCIKLKLLNESCLVYIVHNCEFLLCELWMIDVKMIKSSFMFCDISHIKWRSSKSDFCIDPITVLYIIDWILPLIICDRLLYGKNTENYRLTITTLGWCLWVQLIR